METTATALPDKLRLDNQLCFSIYAASRAITKAYRPLLDPLGLTYPQYLVLLILWEHEVQSVHDIGERLFLDSGTLTPLLKRMEASGFIERSRCCEDERKVDVKLGPRGVELRADALRIPESLLETSRLESDEVDRTKAMVDQVLTKMLDCGCSEGVKDKSPKTTIV